MLSVSSQVLAYVVLAALVGLGFGYLRWRRRSSSREAEIAELKRDLLEARTAYALAASEHADELRAKSKALAKLSADLEQRDEAQARAPVDRDVEFTALGARVDKLQRLEARVCELTLSLATRDQELAAVRESYLTLQPTHESPLETNEGRDETWERYLSLIKELTDQLALQLEQAREMEATLVGQDAERDRLLASLNEREARIRDLDSHVSAVNAELSRYRGRAADLEGALAEKKSEIAKHVSRIVEKEKQLRDLRGTLEASESRTRSLVAEAAERKPRVAREPAPEAVRELAFTPAADVGVEATNSDSVDAPASSNISASPASNSVPD